MVYTPMQMAHSGQAGASPRHIRAGRVPGQASIELISILGISLVVILIFAVLSADLLSDIGVQRNYDDAKDSVQKLANAADSVYAQGEGASAKVKITLPTNANLSPNATYIGRPPSASSSTASTLINIKVQDTDVFAGTKAPVSGSFPASDGVYTMLVVSKGSYVAIGTHFFDVDKGSVYKSMARNETRNETITFSAASNESVAVSIDCSWAYENVGLTLSSSSFNVSIDSDTAINLSFASNTSAAGLYNSELVITGVSQATGIEETFTIPITADVNAG